MDTLLDDVPSPSNTLPVSDSNDQPENSHCTSSSRLAQSPGSSAGSHESVSDEEHEDAAAIEDQNGAQAQLSAQPNQGPPELPEPAPVDPVDNQNPPGGDQQLQPAQPDLQAPAPQPAPLQAPPAHHVTADPSVSALVDQFAYVWRNCGPTHITEFGYEVKFESREECEEVLACCSALLHDKQILPAYEKLQPFVTKNQPHHSARRETSPAFVSLTVAGQAILVANRNYIVCARTLPHYLKSAVKSTVKAIFERDTAGTFAELWVRVLAPSFQDGAAGLTMQTIAQLDLMRLTPLTYRLLQTIGYLHEVRIPDDAVLPSELFRGFFSELKHQCAACGRVNVADNRLKRCACCRTACYCSKDCQTAHWDTHKYCCKVLTFLKARSPSLHQMENVINLDRRALAQIMRLEKRPGNFPDCIKLPPHLHDVPTSLLATLPQMPPSQ